MSVKNLMSSLLLLVATSTPAVQGAGFMDSVGGSHAGSSYSDGFLTSEAYTETGVIGWQDSSQPACDTCGLDASVCLGHVPFATVSLDVLILNRSGVASQDILFDNAANPTLNANQLDLGTDSGGRLGVVLYHERGYDIGFSYMAVRSHATSETRTSPGGSFLFFGGIPAAASDTYTAAYKSRIHSVELNGRWRGLSRLTLLAGARIVDLRETFDIMSAPATGVFSVTDNDLYGGQIGAEGVLWTNGYCRAEGMLKAGIFNNSATVRAQATTAGGVPVSIAVQEDNTAFVGEVTAGFVVPIWPGELRFGYQGLWIDGVALAPDQSDSISAAVPGNIDFGTAVYHGAYLGWEATW